MKTALIALLLLGGFQPCLAMDRFSALSLVESGDNDGAVGRSGERSRFQIMLEAWDEVTKIPFSQSTNRSIALAVAVEIQRRRVKTFMGSYHRFPTDVEWYVLWNKPSFVSHPRRPTAERAQRFANLLSLK